MSRRTVKFIIGLFKVFRTLLVVAVIVAIAVPVALYMLMSSDWAQRQIRNIGQEQLTALLGTDVRIDSVSFSPFNRLGIYGVSVDDDYGRRALSVREVDARYEMWDLLFSRKIIIDYATVSGLDAKLYRDSIGAPLNIETIVQHLSKPQTDTVPKLFKFRLNDLNIEDCNFAYDVLDAEETPGRFNAKHIGISKLSLSAFLPMISNDDYRLHLRSLRMQEKSGFVLTDLSFLGRLTQDSVKVRALQLQMPQSQLSFGEIATSIDGIKGIGKIAETKPVHIEITDDSYVYLPDAKAFVPLLGRLDYLLGIELDMSASRQAADLRGLTLSDPTGIFEAQAEGKASGFSSIDSLRVEDFDFALRTDTTIIANVLDQAGILLPTKTRNLLRHLGYTKVRCTADGSLAKGNVSLDIASRLAKANVGGRFSRHNDGKAYTVDAKAVIDSINLGVITGNRELKLLIGKADIKGRFTQKTFAGDVSALISALDYKGHRYTGINANAKVSESLANADLRIADRYLNAVALGQWRKEDGMQWLNADLALSNVKLDSLRLSDFYPGYAISGTVRTDLYGESIDRFRGTLAVQNLSLLDAKGQGPRLANFEVSADNMGHSGRIDIVSDILNGEIDGEYRPSTIAADIKSLYTAILPALNPKPGVGVNAVDSLAAASGNNFAYDFTLSPCEELCEFFNLPVIVTNPLTINGYLHGKQRTFHLYCDTPWLGQGSNSYFEDPDIVVDLNGAQRTADIFVECRMPTKKGKMEVSARVAGKDGVLDTDIDWSLIREKPINGRIAFSTQFARNEANELETQIDFRPGKINFGNEIWRIKESRILYSQNKAEIDGFSLTTDADMDDGEMTLTDVISSSLLTQSIYVNGILGKDGDDRLTVDLRNIQLINIFETLDIDNALISGFATGVVNGSALLSPTPIIDCEAMHIKSIGYNYCTIGDAVAHLSFDDGGKIFNFSADITGPTGLPSKLEGYILPGTEELNLKINANHVKVGFMKPFMSAFTSDVRGYASGYANLYGTFHDLDMVGDIYADSLDVKIDFTNTWYHATDSIHIRPGIIKLQNIVLRDDYGNAAMLNGWVAHEFFHNASFDFSVTDARNFLCYDVSEKQSPIWYGRIFGDGSVNVKGHPGIVDIKARVTTTENTTFTFVLSDQEEADEYQFITFRDATPRAPSDTILDKDITPERIQHIISRSINNEEDSPTNYAMDLEVQATPQAQLIIVMDPIGGDRIRANGSGNMRMLYTSVDNDIRLYGKYTLDKGNYNFTLQDIIRKDFIIKEGSTIDFSGDPYRAQLDIDAYAQINANLSDLDESFLQDKELNRTNVPVRAMLLVRGDMLQPNISFDLEFPTLTQEDTYRKVKSIVSTEDMMSKQIIYLLVLNRFYTPEYMASTTKGNELFSVASSTIASQLSNMLGKLSDNWSIAPNLRSDRGDFSDIEVDVTLSSSLLNNRLLFNGNFGYRDKSLNTNQFVGDFDLEYLLNRAGTWRFKAYNRYNDQNYYLRTAQTTQGLGIIYRKDFDKTMRFLKHLKKKDETELIDNGDLLIDNGELIIDNKKAETDSIR